MEEGWGQPEDLTPYCEPHLALKDQLHFHLQKSRKEKKKKRHKITYLLDTKLKKKTLNQSPSNNSLSN